MGGTEVLELGDASRRAWRRDGPRPVRTRLWRPDRDGGYAPLVLLSHGSGGAAANLAWLAEALSAEGFPVPAVDHHGNSSAEALLREGSAFWWERPADLTVVVDHLQKTKNVGDVVAVVGYSLGGYTAAAVLGARIDGGKLHRLYDGEPILPIPPGRPDFVAENAALVAKYSTKNRAWVEPAGWGGPNLWFQRVPEPKSAKNRQHFDLRAMGDLRAEVQRLHALGATLVREGDDLVVMADPEGKEFCVET